MCERLIDHLVPLLSPHELDALGWTDLPDESSPASGGRQPPVSESDEGRRNSGLTPAARPDDPLYLGAVTAETRGADGPVSLEVMLVGGRLEIGPVRLEMTQARALHCVLGLGLALLAGESLLPAIAACHAAGPTRLERVRTAVVRQRGYIGRNPTGRAPSPPWEGETLP